MWPTPVGAALCGGSSTSNWSTSHTGAGCCSFPPLANCFLRLPEPAVAGRVVGTAHPICVLLHCCWASGKQLAGQHSTDGAGDLQHFAAVTCRSSSLLAGCLAGAFVCTHLTFTSGAGELTSTLLHPQEQSGCGELGEFSSKDGGRSLSVSAAAFPPSQPGRGLLTPSPAVCSQHLPAVLPTCTVAVLHPLHTAGKEPAPSAFGQREKNPPWPQLDCWPSSVSLCSHQNTTLPWGAA